MATSGRHYLQRSCLKVKPDAETDNGLLARTCTELREKFGIAHATIQLERGDAARLCSLAPDHIV